MKTFVLLTTTHDPCEYSCGVYIITSPSKEKAIEEYENKSERFDRETIENVIEVDSKESKIWYEQSPHVE